MGSEYAVERNKDTGMWGVKHAQAGHWIVGAGGLGSGQTGFLRRNHADDWVKNARARNMEMYGEPELPAPPPTPEKRSPAKNGRRQFAGFRIPTEMAGGRYVVDCPATGKPIGHTAFPAHVVDEDFELDEVRIYCDHCDVVHPLDAPVIYHEHDAAKKNLNKPPRR